MTYIFVMQYCKNPQKSILWQDVTDAVENAVNLALSAPITSLVAASVSKIGLWLGLWFHGKSNPFESSQCKTVIGIKPLTDTGFIFNNA